jgi:hypothetical protein
MSDDSNNPTDGLAMTVSDEHQRVDGESTLSQTVQLGVPWTKK